MRAGLVSVVCILMVSQAYADPAAPGIWRQQQAAAGTGGGASHIANYPGGNTYGIASHAAQSGIMHFGSGSVAVGTVGAASIHTDNGGSAATGGGGPGTPPNFQGIFKGNFGENWKTNSGYERGFRERYQQMLGDQESAETPGYTQGSSGGGIGRVGSFSDPED